LEQHRVHRQVALLRDLVQYLLVVDVLLALVVEILMVVTDVEDAVLLRTVRLVDLEIEAD
jgi:hypothetical protein